MQNIVQKHDSKNKLHHKHSYMTAWKEYLEKNKARFLEELLELLRIPSVSARSEHKDDKTNRSGVRPLRRAARRPIEFVEQSPI